MKNKVEHSADAAGTVTTKHHHPGRHVTWVLTGHQQSQLPGRGERNKSEARPCSKFKMTSTTSSSDCLSIVPLFKHQSSPDPLLLPLSSPKAISLKPRISTKNTLMTPNAHLYPRPLSWASVLCISTSGPTGTSVNMSIWNNHLSTEIRPSSYFSLLGKKTDIHSVLK